MAYTIQDLRLSMTWIETDLDLLQEDAGKIPQAPLSFLGDSDAYAACFDRGRADQRVSPVPDLELGLPWPKNGLVFWRYYLEGRLPADTRGRQAVRGLVPLRYKLPFTVSLPGHDASFLLEGFLHPFGLAAVVTVTVREDLAVESDAAAGLVYDIQRATNLALRDDAAGPGSGAAGGQPPGAAAPVSTQELADRMLRHLRGLAFGPDCEPARSAGTDPFTIMTVVRGASDSAPVAISQGDHVQRLLDAATNCGPAWRTRPLRAPAEFAIRIKQSDPATHLLYGQQRGRAVWFPTLFVEHDEPRYSLASYHRSLVFLSLQVGSMCQLLQVTAQRKNRLPAPLAPYARLATGLLSRLYGGDDSTYRSWSARVQVEQNACLDVLNDMRVYFNYPGKLGVQPPAPPPADI